MPPKRRRSSINTAATAPLPAPPIPQPSTSKIPRRKSSGVTTSTAAARRRSSLPTVVPAKITPRNSLVEEDLPKPTPYADVLSSKVCVINES